MLIAYPINKKLPDVLENGQDPIGRSLRSILAKAFNDVDEIDECYEVLTETPDLNSQLKAASNQGTRGSFPLSITFQRKMGCPSK